MQLVKSFVDYLYDIVCEGQFQLIVFDGYLIAMLVF